jgi:hypothetical protein
VKTGMLNKWSLVFAVDGARGWERRVKKIVEEDEKVR